MNKKQQYTIIFDPKCTLCLSVKKTLKQIDRGQKLNFISLYDPKLFESYPFLSFDQCFGKIHFVESEDQVWVGGEAVEKIIELLAPHPVVKKIIQLPVTKNFISLSYNLVNAYRLKNAPSCEACRP